MAYFPNLRMGNFSYGLLNQSVDVILDFTKGRPRTESAMHELVFSSLFTGNLSILYIII